MPQKRYIIGNAQNVRRIIEREKVPAPQLIITSPPYFNLLNYNDNPDQIGFVQNSYEEYLEIVCKVFQDCYDISASDATFWLIVDTFKKDKEVFLFPFDLANKIKAKSEKTWHLKDVIIWDKDKNFPWGAKGNFKNQHEYILFFTKGDTYKFNIDRVREITDLKKWWKTYPERYHPDGKAPSNVWNFITPIRGWGHKGQNHLCPLPFPLVEKIISLCSDENDWILDPFTGSGSVLAIANEMNRNSLGIDINMEYKQVFRKDVLKGAAKYWKKRKLELEEGSVLIKNFKATNRKLRKLKVASNICEYLNKSNNHQFVFFAKNSPKNAVEILILKNGKIPNTKLTDESLNELIIKSKITPKISVQKEADFFKSVENKKLYKYKFDKFYSYTSQCNMINVIENTTKYEFMYSNIALKISND
jgi:DNA modification methylase